METYKEKVQDIRENIKKLVDEPPQDLDLELKIKLDANFSALYKLEKLFYQSLDPNLTDSDLATKLIIEGLFIELNKIKTAKEQIYNMGNIEMLADDNNVHLSEDERKIASAVIPNLTTIDSYWDLGYATVVCPYCNKKAVWHSDTKDFQCLGECKTHQTIDDIKEMYEQK